MLEPHIVAVYIQQAHPATPSEAIRCRNMAADPRYSGDPARAVWTCIRILSISIGEHKNA